LAQAILAQANFSEGIIQHPVLVKISED